MNINDVLPPELLAMIFSKIDDFSDKVRLERVCKHWRQTVSLDWKTTRTCPVPLNNISLVPVLNRWGEWLEELWLQNVRINENLVNQMARQMKCLKHLKLSQCELDGPAVNSIADLFGQQLCSFILYRTIYHPNMRKFIENESSKLEHLQIYLSWSHNTVGTLPTKLPNNLKSFSLSTFDHFNEDISNLLSIVGRDCNNLKILHLHMTRLLPNNVILAIGNIKSLVHLNLYFTSMENENILKNVICNELPNLKALNIDGYFSEEATVSNICRDRPDLVHLNVLAEHVFQISDSLNSLTLRNPCGVDFGQFLSEMLFNKQNKSIQHLDLRSDILPTSSNFMEKLLGQFPDLKSLHCKMPATNAELDSFFPLIQKNLAKGRKIEIYLHFGKAYQDIRYYKYILPDDLPQIEDGWSPKMCEAKCENLVLKKLIKEAIDGGNNPLVEGIRNKLKKKQIEIYWTKTR